MRTLALLLLCVVFFTGCFSISVVQEIDRHGRSMTTTTITMADMSDMCDPNEESCEVEQGDPCELAPVGVECVFDPQTNTALYVSYDVLSGEQFVVERSLLTTRYTLTGIGTSEELENLADGFEEEGSLEMMGMLGLSAVHTVVMPAPVVSSTVGQVSGNEVRINLLENPTNIVIVAEEENQTVLFGMMIFLGVIILVVLSVVIFSVVKKRRQNAVLEHTPAEVKRGEVEHVSKAEAKYRDYIVQHKDHFGRKDLKSALMAAGISDQLADKYLDKYYRK